MRVKTFHKNKVRGNLDFCMDLFFVMVNNTVKHLSDLRPTGDVTWNERSLRKNLVNGRFYQQNVYQIYSLRNSKPLFFWKTHCLKKKSTRWYIQSALFIDRSRKFVIICWHTNVLFVWIKCSWKRLISLTKK